MKNFTLSIYIVFVSLTTFIDPAIAGNRVYSVVFFDKSKAGEVKLLFKEYRKKFKEYRKKCDLQTINPCWSKRRGNGLK